MNDIEKRIERISCKLVILFHCTLQRAAEPTEFHLLCPRAIETDTSEWLRERLGWRI